MLTVTSGDHRPIHPALVADLDSQTVVIEPGAKMDGCSGGSVKDGVGGDFADQKASILVHRGAQVATQTAEQRSNLTGNGDTRGEAGLDLQPLSALPGPVRIETASAGGNRMVGLELS
jgi:hypothetical protein